MVSNTTGDLDRNYNFVTILIKKKERNRIFHNSLVKYFQGAQVVRYTLF